MEAIIEQRLMSMISDDPSSILLIKESLVTDNMWKIAIQGEPGLFKYMRKPSKELCEFAVNEDGANLKWCVENAIDDVTPELCIAAIGNYPPAIIDVPVSLMTHRLKEYAFDLDPTLIKVFSDVRPAYIEKKLSEDPTFCRYLSHPTEEMEYKAIEADPNYCAHIKNFTDRIRSLIKTLYPEILSLLPAFQKSGDSEFED